MRRRTMLTALSSLGLSGCGLGASGPADPQPAGRVPPRRIDYGTDPAQFAELTEPDGAASGDGAAKGVVVIIHGGFWQSAYTLDLGRPLAADLAARGWAAWNLEYRRVGDGGGTPQTFDDVAAGFEALADTGLDLSTVVALGHSAGGHLAAWSASRGRDGWPATVPPTHVIAQAGVLDLVRASADDLGNGAVGSLLGHDATTADARLDPRARLPLTVPLWAVHAEADRQVPYSQSTDYVAAATAAGAEAELVTVPGDHFTLIDVTSPAWRSQLEILDRIAG